MCWYTTRSSSLEGRKFSLQRLDNVKAVDHNTYNCSQLAQEEDYSSTLGAVILRRGLCQDDLTVALH